MKVSELKEILNAKFDDDDDVFILLYEKRMFDYPPEDELMLTKEAWAKLVSEFEELPFNSLWEDIMSAVLDESVENPDSWSEDDSE